MNLAGLIALFIVCGAPFAVCVLKRKWSFAVALVLGLSIAVVFSIASGPPTS